jgi:hypothetical protein
MNPYVRKLARAVVRRHRGFAGIDRSFWFMRGMLDGPETWLIWPEAPLRDAMAWTREYRPA